MSTAIQLPFPPCNGCESTLTPYFYQSGNVSVNWINGASWTIGLADLWLTYYDSDNFTQVLAGNLDLAKVSSFNWTINLAPTVLLADANYILRLKQHTNPPNYSAHSEGTVNSVAFLILPDPGSASSTAQPTDSRTYATATVTIIPSVSSAGSMNPGTKAAIGLGAALGLMLLVGIGLLIGFVLQRRRTGSGNAKPAEISQTYLISNTGELSGHPQVPSELHGEIDKRPELSERPL